MARSRTKPKPPNVFKSGLLRSSPIRSFRLHSQSNTPAISGAAITVTACAITMAATGFVPVLITYNATPIPVSKTTVVINLASRFFSSRNRNRRSFFLARELFHFIRAPSSILIPESSDTTHNVYLV